jgi:hypothetical protein
LQVLFGEDRKSMSGEGFSVLAILIIHGFDLALHASSMMLFPYSMFLLACQLLLVFLPDISVYCALIDYA